MKVEFIKDEGFNSTGGFIEYEKEKTGGEPVYERQAPLTVNMKCRDIEKIDHIISSDGNTKRPRSISTIADLEPARWGSWNLALMGSAQIHDSMTVNIREGINDKEMFYVGGSPASDRDDIDVSHGESFYVRVVISQAQFELLLNALSEGICDLYLQVEFDRFPNFLATWSPSISDGRTIKFLDQTQKIINSDDLSDDFFPQMTDEDNSAFNLSNPPPISITVARPIQTVHQSSLIDTDTVSESEGATLFEVSPISEHPLSKDFSVLLSVIRKSTAQVRSSLFIVAAAILLLWLAR